MREKDGMWAVLAWLQILAAKNTDPAAPLVGVKEVCEAHWKEYGRNYYARYDYEGVDKPAADKMMADMVEAAPGIVGTELGGMKVAKADMFQYDDPVDNSAHALILTLPMVWGGHLYHSSSATAHRWRR